MDILQARVEQRYFSCRCTTDALVGLIKDVWNVSHLNQMLIKVFEKLHIVFCNILWGGGGNDLVKENRGKKERKVKIEQVLNELHDDEKVIYLRTFVVPVGDNNGVQILF